MKRIAFEYICGLLFSVIGFFGLAGVHTLLEMIGFRLDWGGDKSKLFWALFLGLPIGSILGFIGVDRFYFKMDNWNFLGMFLAFIVGAFCNFIGLYFMDRFGGWSLLALLPLVVLACVCVFNIREWPR
jgi:hypothetical protein